MPTVEARVNNVFLSPRQEPYLPVGECSFRQLPLVTTVDLPTPGPPLEMLFHRFGCGGAVEFSQFPKWLMHCWVWGHCFHQTQGWLPQALLVTCFDSEHGLSLFLLPFQHFFLYCDYLCLVSLSIQTKTKTKNEKHPAFHLPEILWLYWHPRGILPGYMGCYFKSTFSVISMTFGRKGWKACI